MHDRRQFALAEPVAPDFFRAYATGIGSTAGCKNAARFDLRTALGAGMDLTPRAADEVFVAKLRLAALPTLGQRKFRLFLRRAGIFKCIHRDPRI